MAKNDLSRRPYNLHEHCWVYEDMKGMVVVVEARDRKTHQLTIPIAKIRGYVRRRDDKKPIKKTNTKTVCEK